MGKNDEKQIDIRIVCFGGELRTTNKQIGINRKKLFSRAFDSTGSLTIINKELNIGVFQTINQSLEDPIVIGRTHTLNLHRILIKYLVMKMIHMGDTNRKSCQATRNAQKTQKTNKIHRSRLILNTSFLENPRKYAAFS